jgi:flavin-dependent thymidylate synthase
MSHEIQKWADKAMFEAVPIKSREPKVHLLWMTPDPLGAIAAACRMYEGKPTYSFQDISDKERRHYWEQARATHLKAPLEFVNFHFFIEGVDRAFTHQMVRQRTAVFAQESMRFAVKENLHGESSLPPSLARTVGADEFAPERESTAAGPVPEQPWRDAWDEAIDKIQETYNYLVNSGMPAEDARGLLPHNTLTRLNYHTNLRNLLDHAGNRLCTQAQFHWRVVFTQVAQAIAEHDPLGDDEWGGVNRWQFEELAKIFRPVCYEHGKCPFQASFDRGCTIRERADRGAFDEIDPREWLVDPTAAWVK